MQPAKGYEDDSVMLSGRHRQWPPRKLKQTSASCATREISWHHDNPGKFRHAAAKGPENEGNAGEVMATIGHTSVALPGM